MNELYPTYFEVIFETCGEKIEEGGFFFSSGYQDATKQIQAAYEDSDISSMKIEIYEFYEFNFPIEKARAIKEMMGLDIY